MEFISIWIAHIAKPSRMFSFQNYGGITIKIATTKKKQWNDWSAIFNTHAEKCGEFLLKFCYNFHLWVHWLVCFSSQITGIQFLNYRYGISWGEIVFSWFHTFSSLCCKTIGRRKIASLFFFRFFLSVETTILTIHFGEFVK